MLLELPSGSRWRGRFWRFDSNHVALVLHPEARRPGAVARLAAALELEPAEARLALHVAGGRTNAEIAELIGVRETTIVGRLHVLTRKLGVRGRVGLVVEVARCLAVNGDAREAEPGQPPAAGGGSGPEDPEP